jgi:16S rRNA processing protein RimM
VELQCDHGPTGAAPSVGDWAPAGVLLRAHGVRGEIRVRFDISPAQLQKPLDVVRIVPRHGAASVMLVTSVRDIHEASLLTFKEVPSREAAQLLHGARLEVPASLIPEVDEDAAYMYELPGAAVRDPAGADLGVVKRVDDNGGQALLVITHADAGERLLPLVGATFVGFCRDSRVLTVNVPQGLWDDA